MKEISQYLFIAKLICKERITGLDDSERRQLDSWKNESKEGERVFLNLKRISTEELEKRYDEVDVDMKWEDFKKRQQQGKRNIRVGVTVAASICLLIISGLWLWLGGAKEERIVLAKQGRQNNVCLVLSTGEVVDISNVEQDEVKLDKGTKLYSGNRLEYVRPDSLHKKELEFNQLIIPKGTFYHLVLSDGTKVWLNADSKLKYPIAFSGESREVILSGEAYFDVKKDARPFVVSLECGDITVLGTSFGVSAYPGYPNYTTLVKGSVRFTSLRQEQVVLTPGEQAIVDISGTLEKRNVDVEEFVGWKDGMFIFKDKPLAEIMKILERWYGVNVIFQDERLKELEYTGSLERYDSINTFLQLLEKLKEIRYEIKKNTIILSK